MHLTTALLTSVLLATAANAAALTSANVAAPAATAATMGDSKSKHHVRFTGYDGPKCNKEHHKKDFKLNVDGACSKVPNEVFRSFEVKRASRTWTCDVKLYSDEFCKDSVASIPSIDTHENGTCWAWIGPGEGSEVPAESMRLSCTDDNDDDHDHANAHNHDEDDESEDGN